MGFMDKLSGTLQGIAGNLSEVSAEALMKEYGDYLMDDESIQVGFKLMRDVVIFTDKRIIDFDKQGMTGQKSRISSIYLDSVINVSAETAGFGMDDSEINITYIISPYYKSSGGISVIEKKFEFPKKYNIQPLYKMLQEAAWENHRTINK